MLILADVFESFRARGFIDYRLDPAHYVSMPNLSWDAMLLATRVQLEMLSDPEMFAMIDSGVRGGISVISQRFARANNPRLGAAHFDPSKPTTYLAYWDVNQLYGWAMAQSMPDGEFEWVQDATDIDWLTLDEDDAVGYILEVDLDYPRELHDAHNDYPLAPDRLAVDLEMLSAEQVRIRTQYNMPRASKCTKLIPNLMSKRKYVCHSSLLKFYLAHGLRLVYIHRVLRFHQSRWLAPYIELNQRLRKAATNDFEKDLAKLANNSVYGSCLENQKKRTDIRLVTNDRQCKKLIEKPHCMSYRIFDENLVGVQLRKVLLHITKPAYVGFTILEISKLLMFRFHYDYIHRVYGHERARLLFTDTDSFIYEIQTADVYHDMLENRDKFDMAIYPPDSPLYDPTNNRVFGKMKDETAGAPILEFVGLRPKMYSFTTVSSDGTIREKHRAKGVQQAVSRSFLHAQYISQLDEPTENYVVVRRIGARLHRLYTCIFYFIVFYAPMTAQIIK